MLSEIVKVIVENANGDEEEFDTTTEAEDYIAEKCEDGASDDDFTVYLLERREVNVSISRSVVVNIQE